MSIFVQQIKKKNKERHGLLITLQNVSTYITCTNVLDHLLFLSQRYNIKSNNYLKYILYMWTFGFVILGKIISTLQCYFTYKRLQGLAVIIPPRPITFHTTAVSISY